jgi:hypothetical protein
MQGTGNGSHSVVTLALGAGFLHSIGMRHPGIRATHCCVLVVGALLALEPSRLPAQHAAEPALVAFRSDTELASYVRGIALARLRREPAPPACTSHTVLTVDSSAAAVGEAVLRGMVHEQGDADRARVASARIDIASLNIGVQSDAEGNFVLTVPPERLAVPESVTVRIRRIGYNRDSVVLVLRRGLVAKLDVPLCQSPLQFQEMVISSPADEGRSVTNDQVSGVDEGGIIKRHGNHLVILHRGKIFTVDLNRGRLRPVDMMDASGPKTSGYGTWYDELLVSGDKVIVIGYSYRPAGMEIGIFDISNSGKLRYRDTYRLRSNDYYSSRNYSSRLLGSRLILYSPLFVSADTASPLRMLPALGRWEPNKAPHDGVSWSEGRFRPVTMELHAYHPAGHVDPLSLSAMHSITSCDLATPELKCESTLVFGGDDGSLFMSRDAVYLASTFDYAADSSRKDSARAFLEPASLLSRIPLDSRPPTALRIAGMPIDQFSFLERDGELDVLLRTRGHGDRMWSAERPGAGLALLRLPLTRFDDGTSEAPFDTYTPLPEPMTTRPLLNRFVSGHLLYADGGSWNIPDTTDATLFVVSLATGKSTRLGLRYGVSRIDALGRDAVVIGSNATDVHISAVRLGDSPTLAQHYTLRDASEGETRSHGFYYRPDDGVSNAGIFGLPVAGAGRTGYESLDDVSSALLFVRNEGGAFRPLGKLDAHPEQRDDACKVSCVDWYGNTRPLFVGDRIFALLGYELVEGELRGDSIVEKRRISFAPRDRS